MQDLFLLSGSETIESLSRIAARSPAAFLGSSEHGLPAFNHPSSGGDAGKVRLVGGGLSQQVLEDRGDDDKLHVGDCSAVLTQWGILHFQHGPKAGQLV